MTEQFEGPRNEYLEYVTSGIIRINAGVSKTQKPIVYQAIAGVNHISDVSLDPRFVGGICWGALNQWDMLAKHYRFPDAQHQLTGNAPKYKAHSKDPNNPIITHITPFDEAQFARVLSSPSHGVSDVLVEPMISLTPSGKFFTVTTLLRGNQHITSIFAPDINEYDLVIGVTRLSP